jgi:Fe-S cluster assembly iron-binding protein IscA
MVQGVMPDDSGKAAVAVGLTISEDPQPNDEELERNGLRIFIGERLVEPLDGRTLDVREGEEGPELVFR